MYNIIKFLTLFLAVNSVSSVIFDCNYRHDETYGYTCEVQNAVVTKETDVKFSGRNLQKNQVKYLLFTDSEFSHVPAEIFRNFRNLQLLGFDNSLLNYHTNQDFFKFAGSLKKLLMVNSHIYTLTDKTLKYLTNLEEIILNYNDISNLDSQSFKHNLKLKEISITDNKISAIEPTTFDHLVNLVMVDLRDNECVDSYLIEPREAKFLTAIKRCTRNYLNQKSVKTTTEESDNILEVTTKTPDLDTTSTTEQIISSTMSILNVLDSSKKPSPSFSFTQNNPGMCNCNVLKSELAEIKLMLRQLMATVQTNQQYSTRNAQQADRHGEPKENTSNNDDILEVDLRSGNPETTKFTSLRA